MAQHTGAPLLTRLLPALLLIVSACTFVWFAFTASWAHPEAVSSAYTAKESNSFCRGDRLDCLRYFDDHEFRVRPVSQFAELLNARLRHQLAKAFGPHPFFDNLTALLSSLLCPWLAWKICRRKGLTIEQSAVCVSFLVLSVGFLSAHLLMFRPGKHLVILFTLATAYFLPRSFSLAVTTALLCALSDESGLVMALVPFALSRDETRDGIRRHWPFVITLIALTVASVALYKLNHIPGMASDLHQKNLSGLSFSSVAWRGVLIAGWPALLLFRSLPVVAIVSVFTALLSFVGGDPAAYAVGFYYGSHMAACYFLASTKQRLSIPVLVALLIYSVFTYALVNDEYRSAYRVGTADWAEIHH